MTVYVDDAHARFGRMTMCHMMADSDDELFAMATRIGLARRWFQGDHFDICKSKRKRAVDLGAVECSARQLVLLRRAKRETK